MQGNVSIERREPLEKLRQENPPAQVPGGLMSASDSWLEAALIRCLGLQKRRNLPENQVRQLVARIPAIASPVCSASRASACLNSTWSRPRGRYVSIASTLLSGVIAGLIPVSTSCWLPLPAMHDPRGKSGEGDDNEKASIWMDRQGPNDDGSRKRTMYYIVIEKCSSSVGSCAKS
jgi:hypothetical protein